MNRPDAGVQAGRIKCAGETSLGTAVGSSQAEVWLILNFCTFFHWLDCAFLKQWYMTTLYLRFVLKNVPAQLEKRRWLTYKVITFFAWIKHWGRIGCPLNMNAFVSGTGSQTTCYCMSSLNTWRDSLSGSYSFHADKLLSCRCCKTLTEVAGNKNWIGLNAQRTGGFSQLLLT